MYTTYFGFTEKPFTLTPNPRFIFLSKNHKEAFAHLLYGINNHYGFIELIGEVGTGKTTVLRTLLGQLQDENYRSALIFNPCLTGVELLRSINQEFGLSAQSHYANELLAELNTFLLAESSVGRTVVLVIDEAQNLQADVLEQIRLISNLETEDDKLIQIILAGQPELSELLSRSELRQLNQRIAVRYRLRSMNSAETRAYISHRMSVAGDTGGVLFSLFAIKWIHLYTHGVPRMINILCDRSLLIAYGDERRRITAGIVSRAIREILNIPQRRGKFLLLLLVLLACLVSVLMYTRFSPFTTNTVVTHNHLIPNVETDKKASPLTATTPPATVVPSPPPSPPPPDNEITRLRQEILRYDQNDVHIRAFNAIAQRWGVRPIQKFSGQLTVPDMFSRLAAKRNLHLTNFKGSLDEVLRFDIPFLLQTRVNGTLQEYCLAVTAVKQDSITIAPALFGSATMTSRNLKTLSSGIFYLLWQNPQQIPATVQPGEKRYEIRALQRLLKQAGYYNDTIDGSYNNSTVKAVTDFQQSLALPRDVTLGELTLAVLTKYESGRDVPSPVLRGNQP